MSTQRTSIRNTNKAERLDDLIKRQESLLDELKSEISEIDSEQIALENETLKQKIVLAQGENQALIADNAKLNKSLEATKTALFTKMTNEKLSSFVNIQAQIDKYYYKENNGIDSRLDDYKRRCISNINLMRDKINALADSEYDEINQRLTALEHEFNNKQAEIARLHSEEKERLDTANGAWRKKVENEPLTETEKRAAVKQKNLETFIGLNVLSKAGIVLFLIGIIALGRFAYTKLPDVFKALMIYILGGGLICVGELFHKKEKSIFSTALISGGAAVLYAGVATSYFALDLFSVEVAFVLTIVVTAITIVLSLQVKSQVVCALGAVGGYLPLVATYMIGFGSAAADRTFLPVSSVYFCLLAAFIFLMTHNKKWYAAQFVGYGFQMLAVLGVSRCAWALSKVNGYSYALPLAIAFAVVSFVIYMMMPASKIVARKEITVTDCVLLALNTVTGAVSVSINMYNCISSKRAVGFTFFVFAVIYALLSLRMGARPQKSSVNSGAKIVLILGTLVFSMFVAPMIFGVEYIGIAWVAEGALIAVISIRMNSKLTEFSGFAAMLMSLGFMLVETDYRLKAVSLTVIIIAFWAYVVIGHKQECQKPMQIFYTILLMLVGVATVAYAGNMYNIITALPSVIYTSPFIYMAVLIVSALIVSVFVYFGTMKNKATLIYSTVMRGISFIATAACLNILEDYLFVYDSFGNEVKLKAFVVVNAALLVLINIAVLVLLADVASKLINVFALPVWSYTLVISLSSLVLITTLLMGQFGVKFTNVIISAIYIALACVLLVVGFKKRYTVVRSGGLVLVLCALAKLCFVDTHALDTIWKIGAYFAFGAVLIVISYFYQRFNKKLEKEAAEEAAVEE